MKSERILGADPPWSYLWPIAGVCLAVFAVLFMHGTSIESLTSTLPWNQGDPALNTWILSWESHAIVNDPTSFFQGNIFHPFGDAIKYSDMMLPVVPFFGILMAVGNSPVLAHNLSLLGLSLFCLMSTYFLALRLVDRSTAALAAISFSFSGYVFMHQGHLQLLTLGFFPLAFIALFRMLEFQRSRDGIWLGMCSALLVTSSFYYGAIWFVCLTAVLLADWVRLRRPGRNWWSTLGVAGAVSAVLIGPIAYVYASFQSQVPFVRDTAGFGLQLLDFLTPPPGSVLYSGLFDWATERRGAGLVEHGFFLGFVVITLAASGAVMFTAEFRNRTRVSSIDRQRLEMTLLWLAGVVALSLSIGAEVGGVPMPLQFLRAWVPGFDAIRAASRLAVPTLLAISMMAAWCLGRLIRSRSREVGILVVAIVMAAVLAELYVRPIQSVVAARPAVIEVLASSPAGAVVELPMRETSDARFSFLEGPRMMASLEDWRPRFNGFSGGYPVGYLQYIRIMNQFPSPEALDAMKTLAIRYVVLHGAETRTDGTFSFAEIDDVLDRIPPSASIEQSGDSWLVDLQADQ